MQQCVGIMVDAPSRCYVAVWDLLLVAAIVFQLSHHVKLVQVRDDYRLYMLGNTVIFSSCSAIGSHNFVNTFSAEEIGSDGKWYL